MNGRWVEIGAISYHQIAAMRPHATVSLEELLRDFRQKLLDRVHGALGGDDRVQLAQAFLPKDNGLLFQVWIPSDLPAPDNLPKLLGERSA